MLSDIEKAIALKKISIFSKLSVDELRLLASISKESEHKKGSVIFNEGESTETLRLIVSGKVKIIKDFKEVNQKTLAVLKKGDHFAEMNLFDGEPHSASALASEDCHLLNVNKESIKEIIELSPDIALEIINVFSQRLRDTNKKISSS